MLLPRVANKTISSEGYGIQAATEFYRFAIQSHQKSKTHLFNLALSASDAGVVRPRRGVLQAYSGFFKLFLPLYYWSFAEKRTNRCPFSCKI
ncbi:MAG: hypothetical protein FWG74_08175 [Planctomycetes bacterium]|nr:hypothetical protein [Planctomycetota bacterium]